MGGRRGCFAFNIIINFFHNKPTYVVHVNENVTVPPPASFQFDKEKERRDIAIPLDIVRVTNRFNAFEL